MYSAVYGYLYCLSTYFELLFHVPFIHTYNMLLSDRPYGTFYMYICSVCSYLCAYVHAFLVLCVSYIWFSLEVSSKSTLPQLDGSNSESKGKTKKSLSVKKRRLGTTRHHPKVKTSMKDQMLCEKGEYFTSEDKAINLPSSHLVTPPQCEVPTAAGHSDSGKEENDQDPTPLVTRKRPAKVQNQEGTDSFVDLSPVRACQCYEQPNTSPTLATGEESSLLHVSGDKMHGEFLWKLLSTTVSKERGAEIREILDSIDQSPTDGDSGLHHPKMSTADVVSQEYTLAQQDAVSSLVCIKPVSAPPSFKELLTTDQRVPVCQHQEAFYSNCQDRQESMYVCKHSLYCACSNIRSLLKKLYLLTNVH